MADLPIPFVDVSGLWGEGWEAQPIHRFERGGYSMTIRRGARGVEISIDGNSRDEVLRKAGTTAAAVDTMLKTGRAH